MTPVAGSASVMIGVLRDRVMRCFRCDGCGAPSIAIAGRWSGGGENPLAWLARRRAPAWQPVMPEEVDDHEFPDVPSVIADAAPEAYGCLELADGRRAAVITRTSTRTNSPSVRLSSAGFLERRTGSELRSYAVVRLAG